MRKTTYVCDRCKKPLTGRGATKINLSLQKGANSVEKETFDFCTPCFIKVRSAFFNEMNQLVSNADDELDEHATPAKDKPKDTPKSKKESNEGLVTGPIGNEERTRILKLYIEDELTPEEIGAKINRATRGIRRAITMAERSGELTRLKKEYEVKMAKRAAEQEIKEDRCGSGASNSNLKYDIYTKPPQMEIVDGKVYDVGCILSLLNAGWSIDKIADERAYDEDVVMMLIEKHMPSHTV